MVKYTLDKIRYVLSLLKVRGYDDIVPEMELFKTIMEVFGCSSGTISHVARTIHIYGFMKPMGDGFWKFCEKKESE